MESNEASIRPSISFECFDRASRFARSSQEEMSFFWGAERTESFSTLSRSFRTSESTWFKAALSSDNAFSRFSFATVSARTFRSWSIAFEYISYRLCFSLADEYDLLLSPSDTLSALFKKSLSSSRGRGADRFVSTCGEVDFPLKLARFAFARYFCA